MRLLSFFAIFIGTLSSAQADNSQYQPLDKGQVSLKTEVITSGQEKKVLITNEGTVASAPILPLFPQVLSSNYQVLEDSCSYQVIESKKSCVLKIVGTDELTLSVFPYDQPEQKKKVVIGQGLVVKNVNSTIDIPLIKLEKIGVGSYFDFKVTIPDNNKISKAISLSDKLAVGIKSQTSNELLITISPLVEDFIDEKIVLIGENSQYSFPVSLVGYFRFPEKIVIDKVPTKIPTNKKIELLVKATYSSGLPKEEIIPSFEVDWLESPVNNKGELEVVTPGKIVINFQARGKVGETTIVEASNYWPRGINQEKLVVSGLIEKDCSLPLAYKHIQIENLGHLKLVSDSGYCIIGSESIVIDGQITFKNKFMEKVQFNEPDLSGSLIGQVQLFDFSENQGGKGQAYKNFDGGLPQKGNGGGGAGLISGGEMALTTSGGLGGLDNSHKHVGGQGGTRGLDGGVLMIQSLEATGSGTIDLKGTNGTVGEVKHTSGGSGAGGNGGNLLWKVKNNKFKGTVKTEAGISPKNSRCADCIGGDGKAGVVKTLDYQEPIFFPKPHTEMEVQKPSWLLSSWQAARQTSVEQGVRYLLVGIAFSLIFMLFFKHKKIQEKPFSLANYRREIFWSLLSIFIINGLTVGFILNPLAGYGITKTYYSIAEYGWPYYIFSFFLIVVLHDIYFYWTHRLLHLPWMYKHIHHIHHKSTNPTVWATFTFHPAEAFLHFIFVPIISMIIPFHADVLIFFLWFMLILNAHGHGGYELFPKWFIKFSRKWFNNSHHHNLHHQYNRGNYSIYFNILDRLHKTNHSTYEDKIDDVVK